MADLSNVTFNPQNPDALFSPDQWLNQFSNFNSKALPWPSSYVGWPTDAMGNPIGGGPAAAPAAAAAPSAAGSSTPGTTINSTPQQQGGQPDYSKLGQWGPAIQQLMGYSQAADAAKTPQQRAINQQNTIMRNNSILFDNAGYAGPGTGFGAQDAGADRAMQAYEMGIGQPQQAAPRQAAPAAAAAPGGLSYPQVLALLANPGKVTTPGANVPASATSAQPGGGVNNAFLGQVGGGAGMNKNFLSAMAALQNRGRG